MQPTLAPDPDIAYCIDEVRQGDRDRYLALLLAPADARPALGVLHAFKLEVAKTHAVVSEPMLGQIRLQWWRESLDGVFAGNPRRHAVLTPLAAAVERHALPRAAFDAIIDGHERDLDLAPFDDVAALEAYCDLVEGNLLALAMAVMGAMPTMERRELARAAGIGIGIAGLLRRMAPGRRSGPLPVPADIALAHGLDPEAMRMVPLTDPGLRSAVAAVASVGARHLAAARRLRRAARPRDRRALLPAVTAGALLRRLEAAGFDASDVRVAEPVPGEAWRLLLASALRRF